MGAITKLERERRLNLLPLLIEKYLLGETPRSISLKYKISSVSIWRYLSKQIKMRTLNEAQSMNRNGMWKENPGYFAIHCWIKRHKSKPELCDNCGLKKPVEITNISGKYKRDINDFKWLCRKCHMESDGRMEKLIKRIRERNERQ